MKHKRPVGAMDPCSTPPVLYVSPSPSFPIHIGDIPSETTQGVNRAALKPRADPEASVFPPYSSEDVIGLLYRKVL